ncbi:MAG: pyruvate ferredoxin oxidoreductase, partial [Synergistales bacterium]|nr:pyruvate ferredoxin oxidoreductase [Synergistales bacterium]
MPRREIISGNWAFAEAMRQINPDVVAAYPITPSTDIPMKFAEFVANGKVDTNFVTVESEHSAITACVTAAAAGARVMTASSANGVALMHEIFPIAAFFRNPIVFGLVNRSLGAPINIHCDHSDSMGARDSGWIQMYSENAQEAYDNLLMAHRIAEHPDVNLPVMVCQDGFITSHAVENVVLEDDAFVKEFIGEYKPEKYLLNKDESLSVGAYGVAAYYIEVKKAQFEAMKAAKKVINEVSADFAAKTGRKYGLIEEYRMEDAEYAVLLMSSSAGTGKDAVDALRAKGKKVGLIKIRSFRPFPAEEIAQAVKNLKGLAIMD